jgi:hypothetical protein
MSISSGLLNFVLANGLLNGTLTFFQLMNSFDNSLHIVGTIRRLENGIASARRETALVLRVVLIRDDHVT